MGKYLIRISLFALTIVAFNFNETGLMPVFALLFLVMVFLFESKQTFSQLLNLPIELKLLLFWLLWAFITGLLVSTNHDFFFSNLESTFTLIATCILIYLTVRTDYKCIDYLMAAFLVSGLIQLFVITFGLQSAETIDKEREYGLAGNPNSLGLKMVYASFALFYLIMKSDMNRILYLLLAVTGLYLFFDIILLSGSRKSAISFAFLLITCLSILLVNRYNKVNLTRLLIPLLILGIVGYFIAPLLIEGTVLGDRFSDLEESGGVESDIRFEMYQFGMELFYKQPIMGVGLNNYRVFFYTGQYSHSDYVETLASTGIVGFILYQLAFVLLMYKAFVYFIRSTHKNSRIVYGLVFTGVLILKIIGLGIILYTAPSAMIVLVTLMGMFYNSKSSVIKESFIKKI